MTPNPNLMLVFDGNAYQDLSDELQLNDPGLGRGSVTFDYDNDGDLDLFVVNQRPTENAGLVGTVKSKLYRNDLANGHWLKVELKGSHATTRGLGSRIEINAGDTYLMREIDGGSSHESQNSSIAHFGLGSHTIVDKVKVYWIGGGTSELADVTADQQITIIQDPDQQIDSPFDEGKIKIFPSYFSDVVNVEYELPQYAAHRVVVADAQGKTVATLIDNKMGFFGNLQWNIPMDINPGLYFFFVYLNED